MTNKTIHIGSDHAAFKLKESVKTALEQDGLTVIDHGTDSEESCDYPDFAEKVGVAVAADPESVGMLFCGTGIGMSMAANKLKGIRAAVVHDEYTAKVAREHNGANVLCLGARVINEDEGVSLAKLFLSTPVADGERHIRRIGKISALEG
ncbi:MAG: ribose 5-phosphate isomerase B [archaeon]